MRDHGKRESATHKLLSPDSFSPTFSRLCCKWPWIRIGMDWVSELNVLQQASDGGWWDAGLISGNSPVLISCVTFTPIPIRRKEKAFLRLLLFFPT